MAWQRYYTTEHITTIMRRVASSGGNASNALFLITWFKGSIDFENIHPLETGFLRRKFRKDRRPGQPLEPVWRFYPRYYGETAVKLVRWGALYLRLRKIYLGIKRDPKRFAYTDLAMTPWSEDDSSGELFSSEAAKLYVGQQRRLQDIRAASGQAGVLPASARAAP
jgi:hypothetical protein